VKKGIRIRKLVQVFFFILVTAIALGHTLSEYGMDIPLLSNASLHAICPFGGVVSIYQYFVSGTYVQKMVLVQCYVAGFAPWEVYKSGLRVQEEKY